MATNFKNVIEKDIGTVRVSVYTTPPANNTTVLGLSLANTTDSVVTASVLLGDGDGSSIAFLVKEMPIPPNSTFKPFGKGEKMIMQANDVLYVESNITDSIDVILSMVEIV